MLNPPCSSPSFQDGVQAVLQNIPLHELAAVRFTKNHLCVPYAVCLSDNTDFRILEALLNKGPLPVNAIGPKVFLTSGSISTAVNRLVERDLVSRVESPEDRRVRVVSLTQKGKRLIAPIFRKHAAEIAMIFADASPKELRVLEMTLKKIGKRAESLGTGVNPKCLSQR